MICKYCGSPLKAGETMCGNCGRKQDSMVQMEGFDETLYAGENLVGNRVPDGGPQRYDGGWILTEQEWGRLVHSVQEERRKYRASRRKTFLCMLIVVVINLVLLLTCIWLNFRLAGLEKSVQETISVQEEQQKDESGMRMQRRPRRARKIRPAAKKTARKICRRCSRTEAKVMGKQSRYKKAGR